MGAIISRGMRVTQVSVGPPPGVALSRNQDAVARASNVSNCRMKISACPIGWRFTSHEEERSVVGRPSRVASATHILIELLIARAFTTHMSSF